MIKKRKPLFISILIVLLLIVFLTGFTFAKYYTNYDAQSTKLEVAKWYFKVNQWTSESTNTISLLDTLNHNGKVNLENGKMAPGFSGMVELVLDASESDVDVKYTITANEAGRIPYNMYFRAKVDGQWRDGVYENLNNLTGTEFYESILEAGATQTIQLYAIWPYETGNPDDDDVDTDQGTGEKFDYDFTLNVVGTQAKASEVRNATN